MTTVGCIVGKKMSENSELKLRLNHNPISDLQFTLAESYYFKDEK